MLIVFDAMIGEMEANKKFSPIVTELFIRGRKLNILFVFVLQSYFKFPKTIIPNATHCFIIKIPNKRQLKQIVSHHLADIEFKDFIKLYKGYIKELFSFLVNDKTLPLVNSLRSRRNLL